MRKLLKSERWWLLAAVLASLLLSGLVFFFPEAGSAATSDGLPNWLTPLAFLALTAFMGWGKLRGWAFAGMMIGCDVVSAGLYLVVPIERLGWWYPLLIPVVLTYFADEMGVNYAESS